MFSEEMIKLGKQRSTIREIFEYGNLRAAEVGRENIFDFSIGNPNVPAPAAVQKAIEKILQDPIKAHGYTSAQGAADVRKKLAEQINLAFGTAYNEENFYLTAGAAAALSAVFKALSEKHDDEFIIIAPYFPEYKMFIEQGANAKCVIVSPDIMDFQINFEEIANKISAKTKAVVINSPNNPSGAVYSEKTIQKLSALLKEKSEEYGHAIYIVSDEPYRELIYDGKSAVFVPNYYKDTVVCYSYSKSLSLPGERIGYVLVPSEAAQSETLYAAICGAGRALGYVCAPSMFQYVIAECLGQTADISIYQKNRDLLFHSLTQMGYSCVKPQGAFYLFPQTLEKDDASFCERAKKYDLLLVPGKDFGAPGHMRISYCVQTETIERALPLFEKLAKEYQK